MIKKFTRVLALGTLAIGMSAVFPAGALPPGVRDTYNKPTARQYDPECASGEHLLYFEGPSRLWPPNHKYYNGGISVIAEDTDGDETISLTSTGTHNQYDGDTEWNGSGKTADDIKSDGADSDTSVAGVATNDSGTRKVDVLWKVRAERSGHKSDALGEGRVYTITGRAVFGGDDDQSCEHEWQITVPHDMSPKNR